MFPPSMNTTLLFRPPSCLASCALTHSRDVRDVIDDVPLINAKSPSAKPGKSWLTFLRFNGKSVLDMDGVCCLNNWF